VVDGGRSGPIIGTIHASKGREARTVVLILPKERPRDDVSPPEWLEESRVCYVGATRARKCLIVGEASSPIVGNLSSGRIYRFTRARNKIQMEIGRDGDVDHLAHLTWANAMEIQSYLASCVGHSTPIVATSSREAGYAFRLVAERSTHDGNQRLEIGQMSAAFQGDLGQVWSLVDKKRKLKPASTIQHLYVPEVTTVALSETERDVAQGPLRQSGFALAPIVRGFPTIPFFTRLS
jgi:ATP-dependent exoDNAse (exonuclease V) beta subunit